MSKIETIDELVDFLDGPTAIGDWLGIRPSAVSNWSASGVIPSGWHLRLFLECLRRGVVPDPVLFGVTEEEVRVVAQRFRPPRTNTRRRPALAIRL